MGACAWVLGRNGRLTERDAWGVAGREVRMGGGVACAEKFWVIPNLRAPGATPAKPMQIKNLPSRAPSGEGALDQRAAI